jgi:hypothetical protein
MRLKAELAQQLKVQAHIAPWNNKSLFVDDFGTEARYADIAAVNLIARFYQYQVKISFGTNSKLETSLNLTLEPRNKKEV